MSKENTRVKYIIDEKKETVVAIIPNCRYDFLNIIKKYFPHLSAFVISNNEDIMLKDQYVGIARVKNGDTFDIEKGKEIATKKAIVRYNKDLTKKLQKLNAKFETTSIDLKRRIDNANNRIERLVDIIKNS